MSPSQWHVGSADLVAYGGGSLAGVAADSVEAHLLRCDACRSALAARVPAGERERRWDLIAAAIDRPTGRSRVAAWLRLAVGTPELVISAASLLVALLAVPLLLTIGNPRAGITWFLALAPAAPVAGAVLAYRAAADPAGEISLATPMHSFRIVLIRASVALAAAIPVGMLTSALLPSHTVLLLGWLVPGVAFCAVVLAAGTWCNPATVGAVLAGGWAVFVVGGFARERELPVATALEQVAINAPAFQLSFVVIAVLALGVFLVRRDGVAYSRAS